MTPSSLQSHLDALAAEGRLRSLRTVGTAQGPEVELDGRRVLLFCSNDYLALAGDPRLKQAAIDATQAWGTGAGASRLISGNMGPHDALEATLADWYSASTGAEPAAASATLFGSGYHANTGLIPAIAGQGTVFSDESNHASIIDGVRLSRARKHVFRHGDLGHLEALLRTEPAQADKLIVTDSVFSMDGDEASLRDLSLFAKQYDATLLVDEAHAVGVLGPQGAGLAAEQGLTDERVLRMGTLGKALGSFGAFAVSSPLWRQYFVNAVRSVIFTTALPPAACAAAVRAVEIVRAEPPRRARLLELAARVRTGLRQQGFNVPDGRTPIVPVIVGDNAATMALSARLLEAGIYVQGIRPPTVPAGTSRLRLTLCAAHTDAQIERLLAAFAGA